MAFVANVVENAILRTALGFSDRKNIVECLNNAQFKAVVNGRPLADAYDLMFPQIKKNRVCIRAAGVDADAVYRFTGVNRYSFCHPTAGDLYCIANNDAIYLHRQYWFSEKILQKLMQYLNSAFLIDIKIYGAGNTNLH
jgi:hypothetical protein